MFPAKPASLAAPEVKTDHWRRRHHETEGHTTGEQGNRQHRSSNEASMTTPAGGGETPAGRARGLLWFLCLA